MDTMYAKIQYKIEEDFKCTVESTYKGRFYKGQLLIRDSLKSTDFFLSLVYKFLPFIRDKNCLSLI